ncbi:MAG: O-antigen ligase family protein [Gemmatimonadaceae bacterium]
MSAARWALLLVALTPLAMDRGVLFPYVSAKVLAVRALVTLAIVLVLAALLLSRDFRLRFADCVARLGRSPLAHAVAALFVVLAVSTAVAANTIRAFYGDPERGEGLVGLAPFFGFFALACVLFERRHWTRFFALAVGAGVVLSVHAVWQWSGGVARPGSLTGHPAHLGPYCVFVIGASVLLAAEAKTRWTRTAVLAAIPAALAAMLVSETRAAILGVGLALPAVLGLVALRSASRPRIRTAALVALGFLVLGGSALLLTRRSPVWQSVPGVKRVANFNFGDPTTNWRLGVWQASLEAASPRTSGWGRQLLGWGLENFHVPFNRHYDPPRSDYDPEWYDRSHNVPLDMLVMAGVAGLAAYLALWAAFAAEALRRSRPLPQQAALLFVAVAHFVHNLVSFDSLPTYVPLFGLFAFAAATASGVPADRSESDPERESHGRISKKQRSSGAVRAGRDGWREFLPAALIGVFAAFSVYALVAHSIPAYLQMRGYVTLYRESRDVRGMLNRWNELTSRPTYAQPVIVKQFLPTARVLLRRDLGRHPLLAAGITAMEEVVRRDTLDPRHMLALGEALGEYADLTGNAELHRAAELYLRRGLAMAPGRRHLGNALAINRFRQRCTANAPACYYALLGDMASARNREGVTLVRERLELLDAPRVPVLANVKRLVDEAKWDSIRVRVNGDNVTLSLSGTPQP